MLAIADTPQSLCAHLQNLVDDLQTANTELNDTSCRRRKGDADDICDSVLQSKDAWRLLTESSFLAYHIDQLAEEIHTDGAYLPFQQFLTCLPSLTNFC